VAFAALRLHFELGTGRPAPQQQSDVEALGCFGGLTVSMPSRNLGRKKLPEK